MRTRWLYLFGFLALVVVLIWLAVWQAPEAKLSLIACDVGQGDAILAVYGETQILIDGGPNKKVLDCLGRHIPFYDRKIELVILTHPESDHFGGLIDVFKTYDVEIFLANNLDSGSRGYEVLKKAVGGSGARVVNPEKIKSVRFGLIHLDIIHPSEEFLLANASPQTGETINKVLGAFTSKKSPNDFSIVAILSFGEFDALLTGDIGPVISDTLAEKLAVNAKREWEYIKVPHHGSKNGLTERLLTAVRPEIAVISVGKNNSYGHPHGEVIKLLRDRGIRIFRTDLPTQAGETRDVVVETDGKRFWLKE